MYVYSQIFISYPSSEANKAGNFLFSNGQPSKVLDFLDFKLEQVFLSLVVYVLSLSKVLAKPRFKVSAAPDRVGQCQWQTLKEIPPLALCPLFYNVPTPTLRCFLANYHMVY